MVSVFMSGQRWSQSLGGAGGLPVGGRGSPGPRTAESLSEASRGQESCLAGEEGAAALCEYRACESGSG